MKPGGEMSLEVALTIAWRQLSLIPKYGHREVLFLYSGLSTSDPGDIFETIKEVKKQVATLHCLVCVCVCALRACAHARAVAASHRKCESRSYRCRRNCASPRQSPRRLAARLAWHSTSRTSNSC